MSPYLRLFYNKWKHLLLIVAITYLCILYLPIFGAQQPLEVTDQSHHLLSAHQQNIQLTGRPEVVVKKSLEEYHGPIIPPSKLTNNQENEKPPESLNDGKFVFKMDPKGGGEPFYIEDIMTSMNTTLKERLTCKNQQNVKPKILLTWNAGHGMENLGGCRDWNCMVVNDKSKLNEADAVMIAFDDPSFKRRDSEQYTIYFSQESPMNAGWHMSQRRDFFNLSLGFRHDTAAASPYGYTVKLAPQSRKSPPLYDSLLVDKKTKGAAWFVSHCGTNSKRENIVAKLQEYFPVDIYGGCRKLKCPRNTPCEDALDTDYHFYIAFENSICKDYITEKLWNQGYRREIIPVVLKRSIVEPFVPPKSFIAVDDFSSIPELANYLKYLMSNKTAYGEFFNWRSDYRVVFLNGANHDALERPWGFCQVCRLMWESPRQRHIIEDFDQWWGRSCEHDGELARKILTGTVENKPALEVNNPNLRDRINNFNKNNP
ncbi:hypothetical protein WR25_04328 [Diploscapter pachys]|uniref:Fucosyltransferase n=1 Tax=Diploscapter pachys TaxID=2018661 RepID=A0A2A2JIV9_9BILA|nr:hypothetical protein WR25_04328 [Diploscapter pachys]